VAGDRLVPSDHRVVGSAVGAAGRAESVGKQERLHPLPLQAIRLASGEEDPKGNPVAGVPTGIKDRLAFSETDRVGSSEDASVDCVIADIKMSLIAEMELTHREARASSVDTLRRCLGNIAKGGSSERDLRVSLLYDSVSS